jgi:hypothetical protein
MKNSIWHDYPNLEEFDKETRFVQKQKKKYVFPQ